uniref:Putative LAGLIDADG homing endonuclease n=1 Tax=Stigeoclonium helveticum TaxID=55999 RepID=A0A6M4SRK8_STIHE|nr:putative LAGLIDADG homing endonuclease [Stigeoclonium helveticum]
MWLQKFLYERGYCSDLIPKISKQINKKTGKTYYSIKIRTWSFSSFNYIYDLFYKNKQKIVPITICDFLTPLALAIWFMDNDSKHSAGVLLHTNSFTKKEVE